MNTDYLEKARERIPNVPLLINVVAKRVRQLNAGQRPMYKPERRDVQPMDIALREIAEGKLTAEINYTPPPAEDENKVINL